MSNYSVTAFSAPGEIAWRGFALTADEAVVLVQRCHAFGHVEVVDRRRGLVVPVDRPAPPFCAHGVARRWDFDVRQWTAGPCAPCLLAERGEPGILSVPGATPGAAKRFRG